MALTNIHQGHGGSVTVGSTTLDIHNWKLKKSRALQEVTHSGSGGVRQRKATVKDSSGTFEMPWQDNVDPSSAGFAEGADIALQMKLGDSALKFALTSALIESLDYAVDNQNGVVMLVVTWQGNSLCTGPA